jgi:hypothetical protein
MSALIECETKSLDLELVVKYLEMEFKDYDSSIFYPYDLEDALLMWVNNCLQHFKRADHTSRFLKDIDGTEIEDIASELDSGWLLALICAQYFASSFGLPY